jgi:DNA-binding IclR family transcriptional regulator
MQPTVSRSVDRVFQIFTLFAARQRPLTATEIGSALEIPHSSAVSLLTRLVALGYLEQNTTNKRFSPSLQLTVLCEAIPNGVGCGILPTQVADAVYDRRGETTFVSRLSDLFTLPVYVRAATYRGAHVVATGRAGGLATESVTGHALLSSQSDEDLAYFIKRTEHWARRARVATTHGAAQVKQCVQSIRESGYLCTFDQLLPGLGVLSCPLPSAIAGKGLAITIAGPTERLRADFDATLETIREEIHQHYDQVDVPVQKPAI